MDSATETLMAIVSADKAGQMNKDAQDWQGVTQQYSLMMRLISDLLKCDDLEETIFETAMLAGYDAMYNLALAQYFEGNYTAAISMLNNVDITQNIKARVLKGLCSLQELPDGSNLTALDSLYNYFSFLDSAKEVLENIGSLHRIDQVIIAFGYKHLALLFRLGRGAPQSIEKAHDVIEKGISVISDVVAKQLLSDELDHYRQNLFGGYRYIES